MHHFPGVGERELWKATPEMYSQGKNVWLGKRAGGAGHSGCSREGGSRVNSVFPVTLNTCSSSAGAQNWCRNLHCKSQRPRARDGLSAEGRRVALSGKQDRTQQGPSTLGQRGDRSEWVISAHWFQLLLLLLFSNSKEVVRKAERKQIKSLTRGFDMERQVWGPWCSRTRADSRGDRRPAPAWALWLGQSPLRVLKWKAKGLEQLDFPKL